MFIVNLASVHKYDIHKSIDAFAALYTQQDQSCCPGFFTNWFNKGWVLLQYHRHKNTLIAAYRRGELNTEQFVGQLFTNLQVSPEKITNAWTAAISFDEETENKMRHLLTLTKDEKIYLIANTNEMDLQKIVNWFAQTFSDIRWVMTEDNLNKRNQPIEIAPNIYLCLSCRYGVFKNESPYLEIPPMLAQLRDQISQSAGHDMTIVSQYSEDRAFAQKLGMQCKNPKDFFQIQEHSERAHLKLQ